MVVQMAGKSVHTLGRVGKKDRKEAVSQVEKGKEEGREKWRVLGWGVRWSSNLCVHCLGGGQK